ncbi:hypothetical protein [Ekhidna sp.]|uniref:hypothetical protein n=1 Tax=Ekhidna sp. TaxID=2608089 RepID=UPI003B5B6C37
MKYLLILFLPLTFSFTLSAQSLEKANAKIKEMGLSERDIADLCTAAKGKGVSFFPEWGVHPLIELVFDIELDNDGKAWDEYSSQEVAKAAFVKLWEEKYSHCYCDFGPGTRATLDAVSLYHEGADWVFNIYHPERDWGANINKIRWISFQQEIEGTILDYVEWLQNESNSYKVEEDSDFKTNVLSAYISKLIGYGAKRMSEMTPEEIERNSQ